MKTLRYFLPIAIAVLCMSAAYPSGNAYTMSKDYIVGIHGTSNLHDWDEKVETVNGNGVIDWNTDGSFNLRAVNIKMAVHSIKSTEGSIMNNNTYKALNADDHPDIVFSLAAPITSIPANANGKVISAKVNLSIAGNTKAIDMIVGVTAQGHSSIAFEGSKTIKMTDFGVKPPVALLGTLKTGNDITIHFKTVFASN